MKQQVLLPWSKVVASPSSSQESSEDCVICMEPIGKKNVSITKCGHTFCTSCLLRAAQSNTDCPLCRTELASKEDLITPEDLDEAYTYGHQRGSEETETRIATEHSILVNSCKEKQDEILQLKQKIKDLEKQLDDSSSIFSETKKKSFNRGYEYGISVSSRNSAKVKTPSMDDWLKSRKSNPETIDEWFKMRM